MGFTVGEVIESIRLRHPAYRREVVPTRVLVQAFGQIQRRLAQQGTRRYAGLLKGVVPIVLDLDPANLPGIVGADTTGGLPASEDASGNLTLSNGTAGSLATYDWANATVVVDDFVPTSASTTVIGLTGAGRTIDADIGLALWIVDGPGSGPDAVRIITDNTATTWTVGDAFDTAPTVDTSVCRIVVVPSITADSTAGGAVTQIPSTQETVGYLVRLDANGNPYLDLTQPIVARLRSGIPLPPHDRLSQLEIIPDMRNTNDQLGPFPWGPQAVSVPIFHQNRRETGGRCAWVQGDQMYLGGPQNVWTNVTSLALTYVPIPPLFDGEDRDVLDAYFLLPDTAYDVVIAHAAEVAATFARARGEAAAEPDMERADAQALLGDWLTSLSQRATALRRTAMRNR